MVLADSPAPSNNNNNINYLQFTEVLHLIARNSRSDLAYGSVASRLRCILKAMNLSDGRNKIMQTDRNALALPTLKLCEESTEELHLSPAMTFGGGGSSRPHSRSTTPTPADRRRSTTPPLTRRSCSSNSLTRARTPPPGSLGGRVDNLRTLRSSTSGEGIMPSGGCKEDGIDAFVDAFAECATGIVEFASPNNGAGNGSPALRSVAPKRTRESSASRSRPAPQEPMKVRAVSMGTPQGGARHPAMARRASSGEVTRKAPSVDRPSSAGRASGRTVRGLGGDMTVKETRPRPFSAGRGGQRPAWV